jgi:uncharacterized protein (TIGR02246 family)
MKINRTIAKIAIPLCLSFFLISMHAQNQSSTADPNTAAIKQLIAEYSDSLNHHDAHGVAMLFAEDCDFTNMRGMSHHGRVEIEPFFATLFSGPLKNAHRTDTVKSIRVLTPDLAAVDGFLGNDGNKNRRWDR